MKIALSLGHWGKFSRPHDRGATGTDDQGKLAVEAWEALPLLVEVALRLEHQGHEVLLLTYGNYSHRNRAANAWGAELYLEFHLNAGGGRYSMVLYDARGGDVRQSQALELAKAMSQAMGNGAYKAVSTQENGRGHHNISKVKAPAFILEPAFIDNPGQLRAYREGRAGLVSAVVGWIKGGCL